MSLTQKLLTTAVMVSALWSAQAMAHPDAAHVQAEGAWARASVPGQQATGGFVQLTAHEPLQLVGVETPIAASAEIHEMSMEDNVMRMRQIEHLALPQGHTVELKPGGYHLMFQQLQAPLQEGSAVPVTLVFTDAQGAVSRLHLRMPVLRMAPKASKTGAAAMEHGSHGHGH